MRAAVHRLISILKHENTKKMQFTDWINVLQATEKTSGLGFQRQNSLNNKRIPTHPAEG